MVENALLQLASGIGVEVHADDEDQMPSNSYTSRILTENEQSFSILNHEGTTIVYVLQYFDFLTDGSKHPIKIFTDHKHSQSLCKKVLPKSSLFSVSTCF